MLIRALFLTNLFLWLYLYTLHDIKHRKPHKYPSRPGSSGKRKSCQVTTALISKVIQLKSMKNTVRPKILPSIPGVKSPSEGERSLSNGDSCVWDSVCSFVFKSQCVPHNQAKYRRLLCAEKGPFFKHTILCFPAAYRAKRSPSLPID